MQMEQGLPSAFVKVHEFRWHRLQTALVTTHPIYELCLCDLHMTAAKRAKIIMDCLLGSWPSLVGNLKPYTLNIKPQTF